MKKEDVKKFALAVALANRHPDPEAYSDKVARIWAGEEPAPEKPAPVVGDEVKEE